MSLWFALCWTKKEQYLSPWSFKLVPPLTKTRNMPCWNCNHTNQWSVTCSSLSFRIGDNSLLQIETCYIQLSLFGITNILLHFRADTEQWTYMTTMVCISKSHIPYRMTLEKKTKDKIKKHKQKYCNTVLLYYLHA